MLFRQENPNKMSGMGVAKRSLPSIRRKGEDNCSDADALVKAGPAIAETTTAQKVALLGDEQAGGGQRGEREILPLQRVWMMWRVHLYYYLR